jgi:hypothetical protein
MGVASATLFFARSSLRREPAREVGATARLRLAAYCAAPLCGALLAASVIFLAMHTLVPDTAIAKSDAYAPWLSTVSVTVSVFESSLSLGTILFLFWLLTAAAVIAYKRRFSLSILVANSLFPIVLALAAQRGQQVQGVRYFTWTLVFPVIWNILELRWNAAEPGPSMERTLRFSGYGVAVLLLVLVPIESVLLYKEFHRRERSLAEFRTQHLERLSSMQLVAFDVGYIGYFTQSPVCDMAGLINGRVRAAMPFKERVKACAAEHPQYAFVSGFSLWELSQALDLKGWSICSVYDLANLRASDVHYLIASPAATPEVCAAAGNAPQPLETVFH